MITKDEGLVALLAATEKMIAADQEAVYARSLARILRKALGLPEPEVHVTVTDYQPSVRPEFPHIRAAFSSDGRELRRRMCRSLEELGIILRADPKMNYVLPPDAPLPEGSIEVNDESLKILQSLTRSV